MSKKVLNKKEISKILEKIKTRSSEEWDDTVIAAQILGEIILGKEVTDEEKAFLSHQSFDVIKAFAFLGISLFVSSAVPIALEIFFKKKGINLSLIPKKIKVPDRFLKEEYENLSDYNLILDDQGHDERHPSLIFKDASNFEIATNIDEFKEIINTKGVPKFLALDHDLGEDEDGNPMDAYEAIKWLVYDKQADIRGMKFKAHTANIQTREKMEGLLKNWQRFLEKQHGASPMSETKNLIKKIVREKILIKESIEKRIKMDIPIPEDIEDINRIFKENGYSLYLVGGSVRDAIMGKEPKDYDLATDALPDKVQEILEAKGYKTLEIGKAFGIINVVTDSGEYEIATFREDLSYKEKNLELFLDFLRRRNTEKYKMFTRKLNMK